MRMFRFAMIALVVVAAGAFVWRFASTPVRHPESLPSAQPSASQPENSSPQNASPQSVPSSPVPDGSAKPLGPFSIAGRNFTVALQTKKIRPGAKTDSGDTIVAMEIRDGAGAVQYRRMFPYVEGTDD